MRIGRERSPSSSPGSVPHPTPPSHSAHQAQPQSPTGVPQACLLLPASEPLPSGPSCSCLSRLLLMAPASTPRRNLSQPPFPGISPPAFLLVSDSAMVSFVALIISHNYFVNIHLKCLHLLSRSACKLHDPAPAVLDEAKAQSTDAPQIPVGHINKPTTDGCRGRVARGTAKNLALAQDAVGLKSVSSTPRFCNYGQVCHP